MLKGGIVVLITTPKGKGHEIARKIIEARLAACINITSVRSIYWWKGKIEEDDEDLLIVKTTLSRFQELLEYVKSIHPYTVPEIIALPIIGGFRDYLEWLHEETKKEKQE